MEFFWQRKGFLKQTSRVFCVVTTTFLLVHRTSFFLKRFSTAHLPSFMEAENVMLTDVASLEVSGCQLGPCCRTLTFLPSASHHTCWLLRADCRGFDCKLLENSNTFLFYRFWMLVQHSIWLIIFFSHFCSVANCRNTLNNKNCETDLFKPLNMCIKIFSAQFSAH